MKIGFIGCGNMGGAILGGMINSKISTSSDVLVSDTNVDGAKAICDKYNIDVISDNKKVAMVSDILFLCVKPKQISNVIFEIRDVVSEDTVIVSIAAAKSISSIEADFGREIAIVRVMPNTPALVGEGMAALSPNKAAESSKYLDFIVNVFNCLGKGKVVSEEMMDAVTAVSGSSPAYVFMMIEAMADAAVKGGMLRSDAYTFAAQAVLGSAKMVLETGKHPGELKDMVCSPGGTTIEAVKVLDECGFRGIIMDAMDACIKRSQSM